ncbi:hypothetical protein DTO169E5_8789 [Paecilomyces variotii]|nr:hypothetical protein DTO169E5_8789 [Paecilomyces variotii]
MAGDSSSTALDIITAFEALDTKKARRTAYHGILDLLDLDEWREVKERAESKSLKRDILGSLPVELVARICQLLGLADIVALQSVSTRWHELLSSPVIYRTALRSHGINGPYDRFSDQEMHSIFVRHAKRRLRLELGRPYSEAFYPALLGRLGSENVVAYCDGRLLWADRDQYDGPFGLVLLSLTTGTLSRFFTEEREVPFHVAVSDIAVAMISMRGNCFVANFTTSEEACLRLPSAGVYYFTMSGDRVAVITRNCHLSFWDLKSKVTREFKLDVLPLCVAIHPTEDRFTTLHLEHDGVSCNSYHLHDTAVDGLVVTHYDVTGTTITRHQPSTVLRPFPENTRASTMYRRVDSAACNIGVLHIAPENQPDKPNLMWIFYDPTTDKISTRFVDKKSSDTFLGSFTGWRATHVSNNLVYYISPQRGGWDEDAGPYILNLDTGLVHEPMDISLLRTQQTLEETIINDDTPTDWLDRPMNVLLRTFGDDPFFGWATQTGFKIYCFDEDIDMSWAQTIPQQG